MTKGRVPRTLSSALRAARAAQTAPAAPQRHRLAPRGGHQGHLAHRAGDTGQCLGHNLPAQEPAQPHCTSSSPLQQAAAPARCRTNQTLTHPPNDAHGTAWGEVSLPALASRGMCTLRDSSGCGRSPGLTRERRWPRSARTGCAGCSGRTGTAGWTHRWSRPGAGPRTHLHGRW